MTQDDRIFAFTNQFVVQASTCLEGHIIRTAINHLNGRRDKIGGDGKAATTDAAANTDSAATQVVKTITTTQAHKQIAI